jgi:hypothetical protein
VRIPRAFAVAGVAVTMMMGVSAVAEDTPVFELKLQDHAFVPSEVKVPAGKPFKLTLRNGDATPAEFESKALKFEKVVAGSAEVTVNVRALEPGKYEFYDEYHEDEAKGFVIAE